MNEVISKAPVVLYGWGGCPCTSDARTRFRNDGVCYVETVWPDRIDPLFHYLQCLYGDDNQSFVFIGGKFIGNGFVLGPRAMTEANFQRLLKEANSSSSGLALASSGRSSAADAVAPRVRGAAGRCCSNVWSSRAPRASSKSNCSSQ